MEAYQTFIAFYLLLGSTNSLQKSYCQNTVCFCLDKYTADCSHRNLTAIPYGFPPTIDNLIFTGNDLHTLGDDFFSPLVHITLRKLSMDYCEIWNISDLAFMPLSSLEYLDLSHNRLRYFEIFNGTQYLNTSSIQVLNISANPISNLQYLENFWFRNLKEIVMKRNDILTCNLQNFLKIENVTKLDLSVNIMVGSCAPCNLSNLEILDLSDNHLTTFPNPFDDETCRDFFPKLKVLLLRKNRISSIIDLREYGPFFPNLIRLDISCNMIKTIWSHTFTTFKRLEILHLNNLLNILEMRDSALSSKTVREIHFGNDELLYLLFFDFKRILSYNPMLQVLHLAKLDLSSVSIKDTFSHLKNLTSFSAINCNIKNISRLSTLSKLEHLNLSVNEIQNLNAIDFANFRSIKSVSFRNNHLISVKQSSFPAFIWESMDITIDLSNNPFDCGCHLEWYKYWFKRNRNRTNDRQHAYTCTCKTPLEWKSHFILDFDTNVCHKPNQYLIMSFTISGFLCLIIFSAVIIRKLRWDIKYYIHIFKNQRLSKRERLPQEEFLYDAFVAYNTQDRKWIMSELVQNIERKHKYKLCLHERDIIPGGIYVDDMLQSIESSRKFILLLSNNFLDDQWCKYEAAIANHILADGMGDKLFIMLLEDIRSEHITSSLKILLESIRHTEWTQNRNGQKLFWSSILQFMENKI
ncbi:toll-like receptor 13 [Saccostrea cucullata]|uniref:toll-like receptor 13 n=1 Tax=Saccostrea cuccullata TaxID=36930 RepID=UPI002ED1AAEE